MVKKNMEFENHPWDWNPKYNCIMLRKTIIIVCFLIFYSCATVHHKNKLINHKTISNQFSPLKLDGFYYSKYEKIRGNDSLSLKYIKAFLLYKDGFVVYAANMDGISKTYCYLKENENYENSYDSALRKLKEKFKLNASHEAKIPRSCKYLDNDIDRKGLIEINKDNSIRIQYYLAEMKNENGASSNAYFLYELNGSIINDTSFRITKLVDYRREKEEKVDMVFYFEPDANKPKVRNYFSKD